MPAEPRCGYGRSRGVERFGLLAACLTLACAPETLEPGLGTGGAGNTGGASTSAGGVSAGGTGGGVRTGGASNTGGAPTGGAASGGTPTGGAATGGRATGGTVTGGKATGGTGGSSTLLVPAQGALLGSFVSGVTVEQLEITLGRKLAIIHNFFAWTDNWVARVPGDLSGGRIPLITWIPDTGTHNVTLDDIINGVHDTMITTRATAARSVGQRFFLRWGHEMNGNWGTYDGFHNGANAAATAKFVSAWRHVHDLFVSAGATNVLWVFCPNSGSVPNEPWNQWINYYPGDSYVDWVGFDGYNWGSLLNWWASFADIAGGIYSGLAATNKPIMIAETASNEAGGDKAAWIAAIVPALKSSFPNIKALVWFHVNKEADWRFDSSAAAATASITMATDPYFNP